MVGNRPNPTNTMQTGENHVGGSGERLKINLYCD